MLFHMSISWSVINGNLDDRRARKSLQAYYNVSCVDRAWRLAVGRLARSCRRRTTDRKPGREWLQSPRRKKGTRRPGRKEREKEREVMEVDGRFCLAVHHHHRVQRPIGRSHFNSSSRGASVITIAVCSLLMRPRWYDNYVIARGIICSGLNARLRMNQRRHGRFAEGNENTLSRRGVSSRVIRHISGARVWQEGACISCMPSRASVQGRISFAEARTRSDSSLSRVDEHVVYILVENQVAASLVA